MVICILISLWQNSYLVVPFGFDQFDNGGRIEKLGVGKCLARSDYAVENAAAKACDVIEHLLNEKYYEPSIA